MSETPDGRTIYDELIAEVTALDERAARVQGTRELNASPEEIDALVKDYEAWYGRATRVLPDEVRPAFVDMYEGGLVVKRIKAFLYAPGTPSALFNPESENLFSFWQHPYEEAFHASILEQRQLLGMAKQLAEETTSSILLEFVAQIGQGFPRLADQLRHRHGDREPLIVEDEYDVQDIERYRSHPDCDALVALVYDPDRRIRNPRGLEEDLSGLREGLAVRVVIAS